jgi:hypothetical protein
VNSLLVGFAEWLGETSWSTGLHESFYMFNWLETTHVLTLMLSLGMLFAIDARMLGWWLMEVPASRLAARLATPMWIGFSIMIVTGLTLYTAIPVRYTTSIWFRVKIVLLFAAAINAFLFHRHLNESASTWDTDKVPPKRTRTAAMTSLILWALIVVCGRFIAYDWYDCGKDMPSWMVTLQGCNAVSEPH